MRRLYIACARSIMEQASNIWYDGLSPTLKDGLQRVQNNALRLILGGFEKNSYRIISEGCGVGSAIQRSEELIGALDHHPNPKNPTSKSTGRLRSGTPIGNFFVQNRQKMGIARLIIGVAKLRRTQKRQKSWPPAMQIPKPIGGKRTHIVEKEWLNSYHKDDHKEFCQHIGYQLYSKHYPTH